VAGDHATAATSAGSDHATTTATVRVRHKHGEGDHRTDATMRHCDTLRQRPCGLRLCHMPHRGSPGRQPHAKCLSLNRAGDEALNSGLIRIGFLVISGLSLPLSGVAPVQVIQRPVLLAAEELVAEQSNHDHPAPTMTPSTSSSPQQGAEPKHLRAPPRAMIRCALCMVGVFGCGLCVRP
jgi:hypothetical protein